MNKKKKSNKQNQYKKERKQVQNCNKKINNMKLYYGKKQATKSRKKEKQKRSFDIIWPVGYLVESYFCYS